MKYIYFLLFWAFLNFTKIHEEDLKEIIISSNNVELSDSFETDNHLERLESLYQRTLKHKIMNQFQSLPLLTFTN